MGSSSADRLPTLQARSTPAPWPRGQHVRLYSDTDLLGLSPPATVHVRAWSRSYTLPDAVLDLCWARFDRQRMLCVAMPDTLRIVADDGRFFTVPFAAPIRSIWPLGDDADDDRGGGLLVEVGGRVRLLRHPLEIDRELVVLAPDEHCALYEDGVLVTSGPGRLALWTSTVADRRDDDGEEEDGARISLDRVCEMGMSPSIIHHVYLCTDLDGGRLVCCQSMGEYGRLDLYDMQLLHIATIQAIDSVSIDGVCRPGSTQHRDIVVVGADRRLTLWTGAVRRADIALDVPDACRVSDAVGCRFTVTDSAGAPFRCDLTARFTSPLTQLCFDTLRCTGGIPCQGLYALLAHVQAASPAGDDFAAFSQAVWPRASPRPSTTSSPWQRLLSSEYHRCQMTLPSHPFPEEEHSEGEPESASKSVLRPSTDLNLAEYKSGIVDGLHLLYECLKLDSMSVRHLRPLAALLIRMAAASARTLHVHHYVRDFPDLAEDVVVTDSACPSTDPSSSDPPLHLLSHLLTSLSKPIPVPDFPHGPDHQSPLTLAIRICHIYAHLAQPDPEHVLLQMVRYGLRLSDLGMLPFGIALPLRAVLRTCRQSPRPYWPAAAFSLIERPDLCPTTAASGVQDDVAVSVTEDDDSDGTLLVAERARVRFARDHRVLEARRLLRSSVVVRMPVPDWARVQDQDPGQLHQKQLADLAERILAQPVGRAMLTMASIEPIVTEPLPIPPLTLSARTRPNNVLVQLDTARMPDDWLCWPAFHNGFAAGLRIGPCAAAGAALHRAWIVYNRPAEPNHAHAGVLLALGLHGHLRGLARADLYWYLSKKHAPTTMAVVLGLAASERATQSAAATKTLALHIPALLPAGVAAADIEIPVLVQACALVGIGLVYQGTANRLMTEMLLSEIGRRPTPHAPDDREAYALCAGAALGLVTLGLGGNAVGLSDLDLADRLTKLMCGAPIAADHLYEPIRSNLVKEGDIVNVTTTGPGAVLALGLMYLQTGDANIAARLALPATLTALGDVRPDQVAVRVACRALVLWDQVVPTPAWIQAQVPPVLRKVQDLDDAGGAAADSAPAGCDMEQVRAVYCQAVAGACLALGLRFAGTANAAARAVLAQHVRWMWALRDRGTGTAPDRCTLDDGLASVVLALAVVMSGTGDLDTFRLLRWVRGRAASRSGTPYGLHMALSMAIGFLFLGAGRYAAGNGPGHVAVLLLALWPRWPRSTNDNRYHVQAVRHLYVLGVERRYLDTRDIESGRSVLVTVQIATDRDRDPISVTGPCLLPDLDSIKSLRITSPRFWHVTLDFQSDDAQVRQIRERGVLFVKRRTGHLPYLQDPRGHLGIVARTFPRNPDTTRDLIKSLAADPILAAFARNLCADDPGPLGTFCRAVLYDCLVRETPEMLATYLQIHATLVELARAPVSPLPVWQLKFVQKAYGTRSSTAASALLQPQFVDGLRARLNAMFADSAAYRSLLTAWIRGDRRTGPAQRRLLAVFLTAFDVPSPQALRDFLSGSVPVSVATSKSPGALVPFLAAKFPDLNPTALAHLDAALRPLLPAT